MTQVVCNQAGTRTLCQWCSHREPHVHTEVCNVLCLAAGWSAACKVVKKVRIKKPKKEVKP